tara:strand:+ start:17 stop:445 length:429 start_codon:yes stop_codon:yes gene_type:complete
MNGKVLAFPSGEEIKVNKVQTTQKKILDTQSKQYADSLTDDLVIQVIGSLQNEGMDIGKTSGDKTFLDVGIFLEAFRGMVYRELDISHPFHDVTNNLMYVEKMGKKKYSVANYSGTEIKSTTTELTDNDVEFESEIDLDDTD